MSDNTQLTISGESLDESLRVETSGRVIRPFQRMISPVVDEFRLRADSDGLHVRAIDTPHVMTVSVTLPRGSLDALHIDGDESAIGLSTNAFGSALSDARYGKSTDDPVVITSDGATIKTKVMRDYADVGATVTDRAELIDPESMRQEPDELNLDRVTVNIPPQALIDIINSFGRSKYIGIDIREESVAFCVNTDTYSRVVDLDIGGSVPALAEPTLFSKDYMKSIANGLSNGYATSATLTLGDELPVTVGFETESGAFGNYTVAPRIGSD